MQFYVYAHYKLDGSVFYIGKGTGNRAFKRSDRNKHWHNTVKKHGLIVKIWAENLTEESAFAMEKEWIALYGRRGLGTGYLVNMTDGGEGPSGMVVSKETRARMSAASSNPSAETRARMSAARKGKTPSAETRSKMSAARSNPSAETRAALSAGHHARAIAKGRRPCTTFHKGTQKWQARITIAGQQKFLGYFASEELAHDAYNEAKQKQN